MDSKLTFWDHIQELRSRLIKVLIGITAGVVVAYCFWEKIWDVIAYPLVKEHLKVQLIATTPMETYLTSLKLSTICGIIIAFPWIAWQAWSFLAPALFLKEKKIFLSSVLASVVMFLVGAGFAYFTVLPAGLTFLANYTQSNVVQNWKQGEFASFISQFLLAFGVIFELPVVVYALGRLGLITPKSMWGVARYAVVIIFILAAVLTPGPDPISQLLMAAPLCFLYAISIGVCALAAKKDPR